MTKKEHEEIRSLIYKAIINKTNIDNYICGDCDANKEIKKMHTYAFFFPRCRKCCIKRLIKHYWAYSTGIKRSFDVIKEDFSSFI